MDFDVQKELKRIYDLRNFKMLKYIYFEVFGEKEKSGKIAFEKLMLHCIEKYPEMLEILLTIKNIDKNAYLEKVKNERDISRLKNRSRSWN